MPKTARTIRSAITTAILTAAFFGLAGHAAAAADNPSRSTATAAFTPDCGNCGTGF